MSSDPRAHRPVLSVLRRSDWGLLVAGVGVSVVGAMLVWSATHRDVGNALAVRHLVNLAIGVAIAAGLSMLRHQTLRLLAPVLYLGAIGGLVAVLSPLGSTINGSRSWIVLPAGFSIQPAELAKVALVVVLAMVLADRWDAGVAPGTRDVVVAWVLVANPIGLVLLHLPSPAWRGDDAAA